MWSSLPGYFPICAHVSGQELLTFQVIYQFGLGCCRQLKTDGGDTSPYDEQIRVGQSKVEFHRKGRGCHSSSNFTHGHFW